MGKIGTAIDLIKHDRRAFVASCVERFCFFLGERRYLELLFKFRVGHKLSLKDPQTFNEKLQWLKLNDRNPLYTKLVDKYEVKKYVAEKVGGRYVADTLGIWNKPEDINWDVLPKQFVLKTTHGGGNSGVIVCKNKDLIDKKRIVKRLNDAMKQDLYKESLEWPYKDVKKRIIAEEFLEDKDTGELRDYKFFCFDGKVKALFVATERQTREEPFFNFFDEKCNPLDIKQGHPRAVTPPEKPSKFDEMVEIASKLSQGLPHVRVDLYQANGRIYFGEYTFYHFGGMVPFEPESWDKVFGDWLKLPKMK